MVSRSGRSAPKISLDGHSAASIAFDFERQLRETIERYELIFKATNDVLYELDLQKGTVVWNEALYTQYGYSREEDAGRLEWWTGHIHPDDALRLEHELSEWFDGKQNTWQAEYRFRRANNSYVYIRDRGVVYRAPDGTPLRIIGSFLDITQQKQLDRAKDEFISLVSHQLRTPLTVIRLYGEMLTNGLLGDLNKEQDAHVRRMTDASVRLIELVSNILDISRLELGHLVPSPEPADVNKLLQASIQEVLPLARERGAVIQFTPSRKLKPIAVDRTMLDQIVHNLLTNAIRYTKPKSGVIEVRFIRNYSGHLLSVSDNGIGIPKVAQPHIFARFYRAQNAIEQQEQGTGLGLYLVKLMTDTFGGKVWFESAKAKGTTFYIQIPPQGMQPG